MKKLLLFLLSLMAIAPLHAQEQTADVHTSDAAIVKAPASSEKPLLVEDGKLWKVRAQNCTVTSSYGFIDYNQWFEGTKVIDGKTYNVLKAQITFPELSEVYEIAYMREDQGKVYSVSNPEIAGIAKWNLYCNTTSLILRKLWYMISTSHRASHITGSTPQRMIRFLIKLQRSFL